MRNTITLITILSFLSLNAQSQNAIPMTVLTSPILIEYDFGSGTGFFVHTDSSVYLITAKHVILDLKTQKLRSKIIKLTTYDKDPMVDSKHMISIDLELAVKNKLIIIVDEVDICAINIGEIMQGDQGGALINYYGFIKKEARGTINPLSLTIIKSFNEVIVGDDIFIFGYPNSLGLKQSPQFDYSRPLIRKGVVAGKYMDRRTLVLDCPTYPGNSGGPVFRKVTIDKKDYYNLIGLVVEFIPYEEKWLNLSSRNTRIDIFNSGYSVAVSGDAIMEIIQKAEL